MFGFLFLAREDGKEQSESSATNPIQVESQLGLFFDYDRWIVRVGASHRGAVFAFTLDQPTSRTWPIGPHLENQNTRKDQESCRKHRDYRCKANNHRLCGWSSSSRMGLLLHRFAVRRRESDRKRAEEPQKLILCKIEGHDRESFLLLNKYNVF